MSQSDNRATLQESLASFKALGVRKDLEAGGLIRDVHLCSGCKILRLCSPVRLFVGYHALALSSAQVFVRRENPWRLLNLQDFISICRNMQKETSFDVEKYDLVTIEHFLTFLTMLVPRHDFEIRRRSSLLHDSHFVAGFVYISAQFLGF